MYLSRFFYFFFPPHKYNKCLFDDIYSPSITNCVFFFFLILGSVRSVSSLSLKSSRSAVPPQTKQHGSKLTSRGIVVWQLVLKCTDGEESLDLFVMSRASPGKRMRAGGCSRRRNLKSAVQSDSLPVRSLQTMITGKLCLGRVHLLSDRRVVFSCIWHLCRLYSFRKWI